MTSYFWLLASSLTSAAALTAAQDRPAPQQATFRAGVDLIQLDVSVLDKNRRPVRGLTAADFTVLVDGQPRPVAAFKAVDLPPPVPPQAPWIRDVAPDVATNTHPGGRVVVILIDDGSFGEVNDAIDVRAVQKAREVARAAVNELGPNDLAAVVFTENNHSAQNFTTDRRLLLSAIEKSVILPAPKGIGDPLGIMRGSCSCGACSIEALGRVAEALRSLPQQRKVVIYISNGVTVAPDMVIKVEAGAIYSNRLSFCNTEKRDVMAEVFRKAQLANVTIEAVDPKGLALGPLGVDPTTNATALRVEFLRTMAETTGGRAVVYNNDMERQVPAILAESGSYYLLGVESLPTKDDGRFHPIRVRVNRPGLEVRTRAGYYSPTEKERKAMSANPSRGLDASIEGALPRPDFPMEVSVAPFAGVNRKADLAVLLAVSQPNSAPTRDQRRTEPVDVLLTAFDPEGGKAIGTWRTRVNVLWNASDSTSGHYEVLTRALVPHGRYELRLGLRTADGRTSSVYTYVEVPDFASEPLSLSGIVLHATPAPKLAAKDGFRDLMPLAPTARRVLRRTDRVTAFLRVYQGGSSALVPAAITTRIVNAQNERVSDDSRSVESTSFSKARSFDHQFDVPVQLPAGEYLLTVEVAAGDKTARRALRFSVR